MRPPHREAWFALGNRSLQWISLAFCRDVWAGEYLLLSWSGVGDDRSFSSRDRLPSGSLYLRADLARALIVDSAWPSAFPLSQMFLSGFSSRGTWRPKKHTRVHTIPHFSILGKPFREIGPDSGVPPGDVSSGFGGQNPPTRLCLEPIWVLIQFDPLTSSCQGVSALHYACYSAFNNVLLNKAVEKLLTCFEVIFNYV